jgi:hypothetical protein
MEKAFNKKLTTLVPSSAATLSLFSRLGFTADDGLINNSPTSKNKSGFISKYKTIISTGAISSVLTALLFFTTFGNRIFNSEVNQSSDKNQYVKTLENFQPAIKSLQTSDTQLSDINIEQHQGLSDNNKKNASQSPGREIIINDVAFPTTASTIEAEDKNFPIIISEGKKISNIISLLDIAESELKLSNVFNSIIDVRDEDESGNNFTNLYVNEKIGISFQIAGSQYQMLNNPTVNESWIPAFHNTGFSIYYRINNDFSLGLNLKNEHYFQSFQGSDNNGDTNKYEQYPNYISTAIAAKMNLFKFYPFKVFSQLALGGTKTGMLGRLGVGFDYIASPDYEFFIDIEGSALGYVHQGKVFYSPKVGFNYGVRFTF